MRINHVYLTIFLNKLSILEILLFDFKKLFFLILSKEISFSLILKMLKAFNEEDGIIGYSIIEIFLINSKEVKTIVFNLIISFFFFQGS